MKSGITPLTPQQEVIEESQAKHEGYVRRVLIGLDQFGNTLIGGHPDETISSHSARAATEGKVWGEALSKTLDVFQKDHGADAEAGDLERAETVEYLEKNSGTLPK